MHNTPQQNADFRRAWDATNARWKSQNKAPAMNHSSTPAQIIDYYDSHPDLTLRELSNMTGRSVAYLKGLLMHPEKAQA